MFEEKDELFEMACLKLAVHAVKRMRDRVRDLRRLQIALQLEDLIPDAFDLAMLLLCNSRIKDVQLAGIIRKIRRDLFADKSASQVRNLEAASDRIVIGNGDVIHPVHEQLLMQLLWVRRTVGKTQTAQQPLFRARAVTR